ncbi:MAG: hypothetical protein FJ100_04985 [Deltaproteobacteria bacterium]|nr:hypothetical protein [Deltaproteobacteria bacterium]
MRACSGVTAQWLAALWVASACSEPPGAPSVGGPTDAKVSVEAGAGSDAATAETTDASGDGIAQPDYSAEPDAAADSGDPGDGTATGELPSFVKDVADAADAVDWDLLDPPDVAGDAPAEVAPDAVPVGDKGLEVVYAHSSSQLYKFENKTFSLVGGFNFDKFSGQVTDIALDDTGALYAVTFGDVFACDKATAACKWLATLPQSFNGLTFVPKDTAVPGKAALIGIANSGDWNLIEVQGGSAKVTKLGAYGGFSSSGDAFSVEKVGTYATVKQGPFGGDKLVEVNPATGQVVKTLGDCGVADLWGIAWTGGVLYGFASSGGVYSLDVKTGKASSIPGLMVPNGVSWWGAGVSTRAAGG